MVSRVNREKGLFITFEGCENCGKSTQVKMLEDSLSDEYVIFSYREPGGTDFGEELRKIVKGTEERIDRVSELFLIEASRRNLVVKDIYPALDRGGIVICDRFYDSTTAYQGYGRGLDLDFVKFLNRIASFSVEPDMTFFIKREASGLGDEKDRFESAGLDFHKKVFNGYLELAGENSERFRIIDYVGNGVEKMHKKIKEEVEIYIKENSLVEGLWKRKTERRVLGQKS